jgi:hypothetical protein
LKSARRDSKKTYDPWSAFTQDAVTVHNRPPLCHLDRSAAKWRDLWSAFTQDAVRVHNRPPLCHLDRSAAKWRDLRSAFSKPPLRFITADRSAAKWRDPRFRPRRTPFLSFLSYFAICFRPAINAGCAISPISCVLSWVPGAAYRKFGVSACFWQMWDTTCLSLKPY